MGKYEGYIERQSAQVASAGRREEVPIPPRFDFKAIRNLSMEGRLTICNMSIEAGARAGLVAPDETTFSYLEGKPHAPKGRDWEAALEYWRSLPTDPDATFDHEVKLDATQLTPYVTWGTNPGQALPLSSSVPDPAGIGNADERAAAERALRYMDLAPGTPLVIVADAGRVGHRG